MWIAGNLTIQITKVLNAEAEKIGDLQKKEGNLLRGPISSALDPFAKNQFQDWYHSLSSLLFSSKFALFCFECHHGNAEEVEIVDYH